jgi:putative transposase
MMTKISYSGYRFPPEIIQQAIWLYVRFTLSFRDVEDLLAERGIVVSEERKMQGFKSVGSAQGVLSCTQQHKIPSRTWRRDASRMCREICYVLFLAM